MPWFGRGKKEEKQTYDPLAGLKSKQQQECFRPYRILGVQDDTPLAWSRDGKFLAFVSGNKSIYLVSRKGEGFGVVNFLQGHIKKVYSLAFHPSQPLLVSGGGDGIFIWNTTSGKLTKKIQYDYRVEEAARMKGEANSEVNRIGHDGPVTALCWAIGGEVLVSGGKDSCVKVWDAVDNFRLLETMDSHKSAVLCVAAHQETERIISAGRDSVIKIWDAKTLSSKYREKRRDDNSIRIQQIGELEGHRGDVLSATFSPDGTFLYSGARDNSINVWHVPEHNLMRVIQAHHGDVHALTLLSKGKLLMTASADSTVKLWELSPDAIKEAEDPGKADINDFFKPSTVLMADKIEADKLLLTLAAHDRDLCAMGINPKQPFMATASHANEVKIWAIDQLVTPRVVQEFIGHQKQVMQLQLIHNDARMLSASIDYHAHMYDVESIRRDARFTSTGSIYAMAVNPTQTLVFLAGTDFTIRGFDLRPDQPTTFKEVVNFEGHCGRIESLAVSPQGKMLVSAGHDFNMKTWKLKESYSGEEPTRVTSSSTYVAHNGRVACLAFDESGAWMASGGTDHQIYVFKASSTSLSNKWISPRTKGGHASVVGGVAWGKQGTNELLASCSWDKTIKIWNPRKGDLTPIKTLKRHTARVTALETSADGQFLVSTSMDNSARVWRWGDPYNCVARYPTGFTEGGLLSLSVGYKLFVTGSENGMLRTWPLPTGEFESHFRVDKNPDNEEDEDHEAHVLALLTGDEIAADTKALEKYNDAAPSTSSKSNTSKSSKQRGSNRGSVRGGKSAGTGKSKKSGNSRGASSQQMRRSPNRSNGSRGRGGGRGGGSTGSRRK